jgi:hypothetical protein
MFMTITTYSARITGPVPYTAAGGTARNIPLGPCLLEQVDKHSIDIIWGSHGESSAALPSGEVDAAREVGNIVLLD